MEARTSENGGNASAPNGAIAAIAARKPVNGNARDAADKREMSVIGADIVITGNIEGADLHIEGKVIGDVRCATLILGGSSTVNGRIYAARVKVSGTVEGAIETKDLAVEASARVIGDISYERLRVVNGAAVEGNVTRRNPEENLDETSRTKFQVVETAQPDMELELVDDMLGD